MSLKEKNKIKIVKNYMNKRKKKIFKTSITTSLLKKAHPLTEDLFLHFHAFLPVPPCYSSHAFII